MNDFFEELNNFIFSSEINCDDDYKNRIVSTIDEYISIVSKHFNDYTDDLLLIKEYLVNSFDYMMAGKVRKAHNEIEELYKQYESKLLIHNMKFGSSINIYKDVNKFLYKGRRGGWNESYSRKDIFHIPFDRRDLIKTQRFSIPGIPSIYLSHSIMGVWEELNRPSFDELFISRFVLDDETKILDLGLNVLDFKPFVSSLSDPNNKQYGIIKKVFDRFILTNLLKIVSSINVNDENRVFKSEYVLPQILLLVGVEDSCFEGVRYPSVKVQSDSYLFVNYALPALPDKSSDNYSNILKKKMKLTLPVNIGLYSSMSDEVMYMNLDENLYRRNTVINVNKNIQRVYKDSNFFKLEMKLYSEKELKVDRIP